MKKANQAIYTYVQGVKKAFVATPGKLRVFFQSELLADCLSCVLLATGMSSAVTAVTVLPVGLLSSFGFACISISIIALFYLQWWIVPAFVAILAAFAAIYGYAAGSIQNWREYWLEFFNWVWLGAPSNLPYSENGSLLLLKAALVLAVTSILFMFIRKYFFLPIFLGLTAITFGIVYYYSRADLSLALCVTAAGLIILLPRVYAEYVNANSESEEKRAGMQIVAIPVALLSLLAGQLFIPSDTSLWKSKALINFFSDVGDLINGPFNSYPAIASDFLPQRAGLQPEGGRLGGPVNLNGNRYLYVKANRPFLLRGSVLDYYTGKTWQLGGMDGDFRFNSLIMRNFRNRAFDIDKPLGGSEAQKLYESLTTEQDILLTYNTGLYLTLFSAGNVYDVKFTNYLTNETIYFNMRSEMYMHYRIPLGTKAELRIRTWNIGDTFFERDFLRLEQLAAGKNDKQYDEIKSRYTTLPESLPEEVFSLAHEITAGNKSPYQKAIAIERWLSDNCEYTLKPDTPPKDSDFVAYFLETRKGYCTYYASAMSVLARCVGLPSRYVTGFALERSASDASSFTATGKTAHAWAEIYFDGIGWLDFDALRWNSSAPLNNNQLLSDSQLEAAPRPLQPEIPNETEGFDITGEHALDRHDENINSNISIWAIVYVLEFIAAFILALVFFIRWIMNGKIKNYELSRVMRKIPDIGARLDFYFDDIVKQLSLLGLNICPGDTLPVFAARIDDYLRLERTRIADVADARMRQYFAEIQPEISDLKKAYEYHLALEAILIQRMGKYGYFFRRAIRR